MEKRSLLVAIAGVVVSAGVALANVASWLGNLSRSPSNGTEARPQKSASLPRIAGGSHWSRYQAATNRRPAQTLRSFVFLIGGLAWTGCSCADDGGMLDPEPPAPVPTTVTVAPASAMLNSIGATIRLVATILDQNGQPMAGLFPEWSSSNPSVATVDGGTVTAVGNGTANITATAGTATGSASITVEQRAAGIEVNPESVTLSHYGDTESLSARAFDANGYSIQNVSFAWRSANTSIAVVDTRGTVTAVGSGSTSIIASADGAEGSASVTVPPLVSIDGGFLGHLPTIDPPANAPGWTSFGPINVTIPAASAVGDRGTITIKVRDHACEDGDRVAISVWNAHSRVWHEIFRGEIFNEWQTRTYEVTAGYHYIVDVFALNGTGFKGNCSFADVNTGEVFISNVNDSGSGARWETTGGAGSRTAVNVHVP